MILLNYGHPLTEGQLAQVTELAGAAPDVRTIVTQIDPQQALSPQAAMLADAAGLDSQTWQTTPLIVGLPGLAALSAALLAEIHGRSGHFPAIIRLRPVAGALITSYEIAEVLNLEVLRAEARTRR
ncbi:MAG: CRISPR-associated protein Csx15 [Roseiflexaceae bacterium]